MNRRKEPCRNFQRGSCQYGDRCKFLHVAPQQSKPSTFGFGAQSALHLAQNTQQQKPNPFGFGVSGNSQLKGASNFGARNQSSSRPFENKWTRSSSIASTTSTSPQQNDSLPQAAIHKCTDPELCKRQIVEDFKNEAPLWKLTCYGHCKNGPCDIIGDISFEELRAAAYEDARRGLSLQSIVERERNLLNSKLIEFDNLLRNPYVLRNPNSSGTSLFAVTNSNASLIGAQTNAPPSFSSFSQLGVATNVGSTIRTSVPGTPPSAVFNQPSSFQSNGQTSGGFAMKFGTSGIGSQLPTQPSGSSLGPNSSHFNNSVRAAGSQHFSFPAVSPQFSGTSNASPNILDGPQVAPTTAHQASVMEKQNVSPDDSIWLKEEWAIGEIPVEAPPERFC
ncbi:zinc finger CCCH domain-containing protein 46 [Elaeis guineensis]|uniref:zinc finger CCCH domain-containing protein 46 n=1 Tax=Elaeis guineensis var. tenera TaxID=51953 RepID=UPI003C6D8E2B